MSIRNDITVDFSLSPRLITISAPSVNLTVQDLVDTLRDIEDNLPTGMAYDHLINAAGKEDLGGGVFVGITASLQDAQVFFESRTTPLDTGTITTANAAGRVLIDSVATFVTDGIARGDLIYNDTDNSWATVLTVNSEIQLTTTQLTGGTDNDYDSSDAYQVYNLVQCEVAGGNLVAVDSAGSTISPVLESFGTQIIRTSSSSATLQEQADIEFSSFGLGVTVDPLTGVSGTVFPTGTPRQPCDNLTDALTIASTRGFKNLYINSSMTIDSGLDFTGFLFRGLSRTSTTLTIDTAANVTNCEFSNATITGTLDGGSLVHDCNITTLDYVNGIVKECVIDGPITLGGASPLEAIFIDTNSGVVGTGTPTIDMGGAGPDLMIRGHSGGIKLTNKTGSNSASIDLSQGQLILDATVTNGTIVVRGIADVTDNSVGATIINNTIDRKVKSAENAALS